MGNKIKTYGTPRHSNRYPYDKEKAKKHNVGKGVPTDHLFHILRSICEEYEDRPAEDLKNYLIGVTSGLAISLDYDDEDSNKIGFN